MPSSSVLASSSILFQKAYDFSGQAQSVWKLDEDGSSTSFREFEGVATLSGRNDVRSWGGQKRDMTVDLSLRPILRIRVLSASKFWYVILSGPQFDSGYYRVIESSGTGLFSFNIPELTKVSGKQSLTVKIGLSAPGLPTLPQSDLSFDQFTFVSSGEAAPAIPEAQAVPEAKSQELSKLKREGGVFLLDPDKLDSWQEMPKGGDAEVRFSYSGGVAAVKGRLEDRNWGAAHRETEVNLNQFPILEINALSSSESWYLILSSPDIPEGYVKLYEGKDTGPMTFNVPEKSGMSGISKFDLQVGVSKPAGTSIKGETVTFDLLRFKKKP